MQPTQQAPVAQQEVWTLGKILNWTTQKFAELDLPTPLLDAQLLLAHVLGYSRVKLYTDLQRPLSPDERSQMRDLVKRRMAGEPVAYLLKKKEWHDLCLYVDERVLIPRPETETLLDIAVEALSDRPSPKVIIDFCTGSGCLALALKKRFPDARVFAVDISLDALDVAKLNSEQLSLEIEFLQLDALLESSFEVLQTALSQADLIVSNPPYVSQAEWLQLDISVKNFEPAIALVAHDEGLQISRSLLNNCLKFKLLSPNAFLIFEMGVGHPAQIAPQTPARISAGDSMRSLPSGTYLSIRDLAGKERFLAYSP